MFHLWYSAIPTSAVEVQLKHFHCTEFPHITRILEQIMLHKICISGAVVIYSTYTQIPLLITRKGTKDCGNSVYVGRPTCICSVYNNFFYIPFFLSFLVVECKLSSWSEWSGCDRKCGKGVQSRYSIYILGQ